MQARNFDWLDLLYYFGPSIPIFLVALAGWIASVVLWKKHPRVSLLAFLGFSIYLVNIGGGTLLAYWVTRNSNLRDVREFLAYVNIGRGILSAGAMILFTFAMFGWRSHPRLYYSEYPEVERD